MKTCLNCQHEPNWIPYIGKHKEHIKTVGRCSGVQANFARIPSNSLEQKRAFYQKYGYNLMPSDCGVWESNGGV